MKLVQKLDIRQDQWTRESIEVKSTQRVENFSEEEVNDYAVDMFANNTHSVS